MPSNSQDDHLHQMLRTLVVQDPRQARDRFCELLDANDPQLHLLLKRASVSGEGRIRHLIANAVRNRADKEKIIPYLLEWHKTETDEFAKRAIEAALKDVDLSSYQDIPRQNLPNLVEMYRYVASRLCHRVRNALPIPSTHIRKLQAKLNSIQDEALRSEFLGLLGALSESFQRISRIVGFNLDDEYFNLRPIPLFSWLESMNVDYAGKYGPIQLVIEGKKGAHELRIRANDFLLETIFWNLWINAHQATGNPCHINVRITRSMNRAEVLLSDNGSGFPPEYVDIVFNESFSTRGENRGRGLLEVRDAVEQLQGVVSLVEIQLNEYRLSLSFPLEIV